MVYEDRACATAAMKFSVVKRACLDARADGMKGGALEAEGRGLLRIARHEAVTTSAVRIVGPGRGAKGDARGFERLLDQRFREVAFSRHQRVVRGLIATKFDGAQGELLAWTEGAPRIGQSIMTSRTLPSSATTSRRIGWSALQ